MEDIHPQNLGNYLLMDFMSRRWKHIAIYSC
jgi:hypothetical protein